MRMRKEQLVRCGGDPKCNSFLRVHNVRTTDTQMQLKIVEKLEIKENFLMKHSKNHSSEVLFAALFWNGLNLKATISQNGKIIAIQHESF